MNKKYMLAFASWCVLISSATFAEGPKIENLLKEKLEGVAGTEVVLSKVQIPPNTSLPKHWHPGEEFAYVSDKFMTQTRIAMRYSTREGKLGWNKFFALSLPEKDD